jgi:hypothetical protein
MKLNKKEMIILRCAFAAARNRHRDRALASTCEDFVDAINEIIEEINELEAKIEKANQ